MSGVSEQCARLQTLLRLSLKKILLRAVDGDAADEESHSDAEFQPSAVPQPRPSSA